MIRPHMRQRPDESVHQWRERLSRSCYRCGAEYADPAVLRYHEDHCKGGAQPEEEESADGNDRAVIRDQGGSKKDTSAVQ